MVSSSVLSESLDLEPVERAAAVAAAAAVGGAEWSSSGMGAVVGPLLLEATATGVTVLLPKRPPDADLLGEDGPPLLFPLLLTLPAPAAAPAAPAAPPVTDGDRFLRAAAAARMSSFLGIPQTGEGTMKSWGGEEVS